ncbi:uncharacterized protein DC041_0005654 [Schistosoma bovis]|uniref:Uncharacterized protein n=1 Tax=Schistosoma bovis TaxID=6184 RepID=A0A430Q3A7_SCHBO|nr:uncharacterized protein DC041_0005654 [Schistosoma bovis]
MHVIQFIVVVSLFVYVRNSAFSFLFVHLTIKSEERIRNGAKKLLKARNTTTQGRIDNFFSCVPSKSNVSTVNGSLLFYNFLILFSYKDELESSGL